MLSSQPSSRQFICGSCDTYGLTKRKMGLQAGRENAWCFRQGSSHFRGVSPLKATTGPHLFLSRRSGLRPKKWHF